MDNELGEDEDIDRFPLPQGILTPRISVIRFFFFSGFRIDVSIEKCPYVTEFSPHGFPRQNQLGFQNLKRLQMRYALSSTVAKFEVSIFPN